MHLARRGCRYLVDTMLCLDAAQPVCTYLYTAAACLNETPACAWDVAMQRCRVRATAGRDADEL